MNFTVDDRALMLGLWVKTGRLADLADELGVSEPTARKRLHAAGVQPKRGRPPGVKDSPTCDRQRGKKQRGATDLSEQAWPNVLRHCN